MPSVWIIFTTIQFNQTASDRSDSPTYPEESNRMNKIITLTVALVMVLGLTWSGVAPATPQEDQAIW